MSTFICPHCGAASSIFREGGARKASERLGVAYLGAIPLDPVLCRASDRGEPILASYPDSPVAEAFRRVSRALVARIGEEASATPVIRMG
jgi:ATP-binding protein involved in chromosome partitioning